MFTVSTRADFELVNVPQRESIRRMDLAVRPQTANENDKRLEEEKMAISGSNDISLLQMGIGLLPVGISLFCRPYLVYGGGCFRVRFKTLGRSTECKKPEKVSVDSLYRDFLGGWFNGFLPRICCHSSDASLGRPLFGSVSRNDRC